MSSRPDLALPPHGTILAGKYKVTQLLGEGGMGLVVEALHLQLDQRVAIKFLRPEALRHPSVVARFTREARAMTRIRSEHVARVIDVGNLDTGAPYMVMEYLEGQDLDNLITREGKQDVAVAVAFVLQACEALAEAHSLGIIHRDLKPSNLFLTHRADGSACIKVLDFGISKTSDGSSEPNVALTQTSALLGSPLYMAPEQMISAKEVDERSDIWALGAILFELLTGSPPYPADSIAEIRRRVELGQALAIGSFRDDSPQGLEVVVMRCMAFDPEQRYSNLAEVATALVPFAPPHALLSAQRVQRLLRPEAESPDAGLPSPLATTEMPATKLAAASPMPGMRAVTAPPYAADAPADSDVALPRSRLKRGWIAVAVVVVAGALGATWSVLRVSAPSSAAAHLPEEEPPSRQDAKVLLLGAPVASSASEAPSEPEEQESPRSQDAEVLLGAHVASSASEAPRAERRVPREKRSDTAGPTPAQSTPPASTAPTGAELFNTRK